MRIIRAAVLAAASLFSATLWAQATTTAIESITPGTPQAVGVESTVQVLVTGAATPYGVVDVVHPSGKCTLSLTPVDATSARGSCRITWKLAGGGNVTASYQGIPTVFDPSAAAPVNFTVTVGASSISLGLHAPAPSYPGQGIVVSALLLPNVPRNGSITISDGAAVCSIPATASTCVLPLPDSATGVRNLDLAFAGDSNLAASMGTGTHTVTASPAIQLLSRSGPVITGGLRPVFVQLRDSTPDGRFVVFASSDAKLGNVALLRNLFLMDTRSGVIERVSFANGGGLPNDNIDGGSISSDGRYIVYDSRANNIVPGDTNGRFDVFHFDRNTQTTTRVSVSDGEAQANDASFTSDVSEDGMRIVFSSGATNLTAETDSNAANDIFVRDLNTLSTKRVNVAPGGLYANAQGVRPKISGNGQWVVFDSTASNLVAGDTNSRSDIFRVNVDSLALDRTNVVNGTGAQSNTPGFNGSVDASISDDGLRVAYFSDASNLVSDDSNGVQDVFVRDYRAPGFATARASVASDGSEGLGGSTFATISRNGLYVAFQSFSALDPADANAFSDYYMRKLDSPTTTYRLSLGSSGLEPDGATSSGVPLNDGRGLIDTSASNLDPLLFPGENGVFVRDPVANSTKRVLFHAAGQQSDDATEELRFSADGSRYLLQSGATNLVTGDTNARVDVFRFNGSALERISIANSGDEANGDSRVGNGNDDLSIVVFESSADNLVVSDINAEIDSFIYDAAQPPASRITRIRDASGGEIALGSSEPKISGNGRFVVFVSRDSDVVTPATPVGIKQVYRYDRDADTTVIVSSTLANVVGAQDSDSPSISWDGCRIAFRSDANAITGSPSSQVVLKDLCENTLVVASVDDAGVLGNDFSFAPLISGDGQNVAFLSDATNLEPPDDLFGTDVYVRRFRDDPAQTDIVSLNPSGVQFSSGNMSLDSISYDGRFFGFTQVVFGLGNRGGSPPTLRSFVRDALSDATSEAFTSLYANSVQLAGFGDRIGSISSDDGLAVGDSNGRADAIARLPTGLRSSNVVIVSSSPNPSTAGTPVNVDVTVSQALVAPTGTVIVETGRAGERCTITLMPISGDTSGGSCNLTMNAPAGPRTIAAQYAGSATTIGGIDRRSHTVTGGGASCLWTGAGSDNLWTNAANWETCGSGVGPPPGFPGTPGAPDSATIASGTPQVDVPTQITGLTVSGGSVELVDHLSVSGSFNFSGGEFHNNRNLTVMLGANGIVSHNLASPIPTLRAGAVLRVVGTLEFLTNTDGPGGMPDVLGGMLYNDGAAIVNTGTITINHRTGGGAGPSASIGCLAGCGPFTNDTGANITVAASSDGNPSLGPPPAMTFTNDGTITNDGTACLLISGSGTDNGSFVNNSSCALGIDTNTRNWNSSVTSTGITQVLQGTLQILGASRTFGGFMIIDEGAVLSGPANFVFNDGLDLRGRLSGNPGTSAVFTTGNILTIERSGAVPADIETRNVTIDSGAFLTVEQRLNLRGGTAITIDGSLQLEGDAGKAASVQCQSSLDCGTITIGASANLTSNRPSSLANLLGTDLVVNNSGLLRVASGRLDRFATVNQLAGSVIQLEANTEYGVPSGLNLSTGTLRGIGTVVGNLILNGGSIAPGLSPGVITITGNLTVNSGDLAFDILGGPPPVPGTSHDQLRVNGSAVFNGGTLTSDMGSSSQNFILIDSPNPGTGVPTLVNGFTGYALSRSSGNLVYAPVGARSCDWTLPSSGNWDNPSNWNCTPAGGFPGAGDTAIVNLASGTVNQNGARTVATLQFGAGVIAGADPLSITSSIEWNGGEFRGTASVSDDVLVSSSVTSAMLAGGQKNLTQRRLRLDTDASWTTGLINLGNDGVIEVSSTRTLTSTPNATPVEAIQTSGPVAGAEVVLNGRILKTGSGLSGIGGGPLLTGSGTIEVQAAGNKFFVHAPGTLGGIYRAAAGTEIEFANANRSFTASAQLDGAGRIAFGNGGFGPSVNSYAGGIAGGFAGTVLIVDQGTFAPSTVLSIPRLELNGASALLAGSANITLTSGFVWREGTIRGSNVTQELELGSGVSASIISAASRTLDTITLRNRGLLTRDGVGDVRFVGAAQLINETGATLRIDATGQSIPWVEPVEAAAKIINRGAFELVNCNVTSIDLDFDNVGTVTQGACELRLLDQGNDTGSYALSSRLRLETGVGQTRTFGAASSLSGTGEVIVQSGTAVVNSGTYSINRTVVDGGTLDITRGSATAINELALIGGTLRGSDDLTVSSQFQWRGGSIEGSNNALLVAGTGLIDTAAHVLDARVLAVSGNTTWSAGDLETRNNGRLRVDAGGSLTISATARMFCNSSCGTQRGIQNQGSILRNGNAGTTVFDVGAPFNGFGGGNLEIADGTLEVNDAFQQSDGTVRVSTVTARLRRSAGSFAFATANAVLGGIGTVEGNVQMNLGAISPGPFGGAGTLTVNGDVTFGAGGRFALTLSGATCSAFDQLLVSGTANLAGQVDVDIRGGCTAVPPQSFQFLTAPLRTGTFATLNNPPVGYTLSYPGGNGNVVLAPSGPVVYSVDTTDDNAGLTACTPAAADCSLRGAIGRANSDGGPSRIEFAIPSPGVQSITLSSAACPSINAEALEIDGYSQPGALPNTESASAGGLNGTLLIEVRGGGACTDGLSVASSNFTVRGLVLRDFVNGAALNLSIPDTGFHRVHGNYFGTNAAGTDDAANQFGIRVQGLTGTGTGSLEVGCDLAARRNLFAGFTGASPTAIELLGGAGRVVYRAKICGNLFGLAANGNAALDHHSSIRAVASQFSASGPLVIGGVSADDRNSFGGNEASGAHIELTDAAVPNSISIEGNQFGYRASGAGLIAVPGKQLIVRGGAQVLNNRLQGGASAGVAVPGGSGNTVNGTRFSAHTGLGIDLGAPGRNPNDPGDGDTGANALLNFPVITALTPVSTDLQIDYTLSTSDLAAYPIRVEFFRASDDEGNDYLGFDNATGPGPQVVTLTPQVPYAADDVLIATATDSQGNTSEFSFYPVTLAVTAVPNPALPGTPIDVSVTATTAAPPVFKPLGNVTVVLDAAGNPSCSLNLVQSATPGVSNGTCNLAGVAAGNYTATATLNALTSAFAAADGQNAVGSTPLGVLPNSLTVSSPSQTEGNIGNTPIAVDVTVAGPGPYPLNVSFVTTDTTATAGSDYTGPASGSLVFNAAGTQSINFQLLGDAVVEANETFSVDVTAPGADPTSQKATVTITNDDSATVTLSPASGNEGNSGASPLTFNVNASAPIQGNVSLFATTTNGTAAAPGDFTALAATPFTLPSLATSSAVVVQLNGDTTPELDETFSLSVTLGLPPNVTAVTVSPASVTGTIINDDLATPTTTLISSFAPVAVQQVGQAFTINVTVTSDAAPAPSGTVVIAAASPFAADTCTATLGAPSGLTATGSCVITANVPGQRSFTASYPGTPLLAPSQGLASYVVQSQSSFPPNAVTQSATLTVVGEPFTVGVRIQGVGAAPTGTVSVLPLPVGNASSCTLDSTGLPPNVAGCTVTIVSPAAVAKLLRVRYNGTGGPNPVFAPVERTTDVHDTNKALTSVVITSDTPDPSLVSTPVTVQFRVAVTPPGAVTTLSPLSGTVEIGDGVDRCTTSVLQAGANSTATGACSLTLTTLGSRPLTARYLGNENFVGSTSPAEPHTVVGAGSGTDLSVRLSNGVRNLIPGTVTYTLTVRNNGPLNASAARVAQSLPNLLGNVAWTCTATAPNACPSSGTGAIDALVDLVAGAELVFRMTATVPGGEGTVSTTASVTPPAGLADPVATNNSATDADPLGLIADGFETQDNE